jgi:hypothetical protein
MVRYANTNAAGSEMALRLDSVRKVHGSAGNSVTALDGVSVTPPPVWPSRPNRR